MKFIFKNENIQELAEDEWQHFLSFNPEDENDDDLNRNVYRDVGGAGQGGEWRSSKEAGEKCGNLSPWSNTLKCGALKITKRIFSWLLFSLFFFFLL